MEPDQAGDKSEGLHIDSDWKQQAEKEKEELAHKVGDATPAVATGQPGATPPQPTASSSPSTTPAGKSAADSQGRPLPPASFELLVQQHITQILLALGQLPDASGKQRPMEPAVARLYIDLLGVLQEKTKNNLTDSERHLIETALYEMRMTYVQVVQGARQ